MTDTAEHKSLAEALVAFQAEVGTVAKDADNPFFKSKYADLPAVKAAAQPILTKHSLAVTQKPGFEIVADKVVDTLTTEVIHGPSNERDSSTMALKNTAKAQEQGSAITYARRYAFMSVLGLVADDDDDGNAASGNSRSRSSSPRQSRAKAAEPSENSEVREALAAVQAAAKAAGKSPREATEIFKIQYAEESLVGCTDVAKLKAAAEHFEGLANVKNELGGTEVSE